MIIDRLTPSGLSTFEQCPVSYFYRYYLELPLPDDQKMHLFFGTAIHEAIDNIYEQYDEETGWEHSEVSIPKKIFKSKFPIDCVTVVGKVTAETQKEVWEAMVKDGLGILDAYWEEKERLLAAGVLPKQFEIPMKFKPFHPETKEYLDVPISLRIDGLDDDSMKIIEFKTSAAKYDEVETRRKVQTLSYVWMMYCKTGKIYSVDYVVMLKKKKKNRIQHLHYEYDLADIIAFDDRVRSIIEKINMKDFNFNADCREHYCDCKKYKQLLDVSEFSVKL